MNVTFRFCWFTPSNSLKLPVFKGFFTDLGSHSFLHISFYPLYIAPNNDNIRFQLFKNFLEGRNRIVKLFIGLFHTRSLKIELNEIIECYLIPYIFSIIN